MNKHIKILYGIIILQAILLLMARRYEYRQGGEGQIVYRCDKYTGTVFVSFGGNAWREIK